MSILSALSGRARVKTVFESKLSGQVTREAQKVTTAATGNPSLLQSEVAHPCTPQRFANESFTESLQLNS